MTTLASAQLRDQQGDGHVGRGRRLVIDRHRRMVHGPDLDGQIHRRAHACFIALAEARHIPPQATETKGSA